LTGLAPECARGRTIRELVPGFDPHWIDVFGHVAASGESTRFENHDAVLGKWFEVLAHRISPGQFAFLLIDITERKRADADAVGQLKLAEAVFAHSISPLVVLDRDYNFLRVNEAYARACGKQTADFVGRSLFEMYPSDAQLIFDDVVRNKRPFTTFTRAFIFPDQPERGVTYWDWTLVPVLDAHDEVECLVFSLLDVTEREAAADALRQSEARYRRQAAELELIYRTAPIGLCVLDTQLRYVHINQQLAELNRLPVEAHLGKTIRETVPGIADRVEPLLRRVLETGEPVLEFEGSVEARPGIWRHWTSQYWPLKSSDGRVFGINVVAQEVTERRRLEETRRREQEFRSLAENSSDIIARFDRDLRRIYVNRAVEALTKRPREELVGKTHRELGLPEPLVDALDRPLKEVFATGEPRMAEAVVPTPKGERYLEARIVPEFDNTGEVQTVLTITRDLTERKRTEDALQASERKYRALVENLYEGVWLLDEADRTSFANARLGELLGYPVEDMLGHSVFDFMDRRQVDAMLANLECGKAGERAEYDFEFRRKGGEPIWTRVATTPVFDERGRYEGTLIGLVDITERKRAAEALYRREQEFAALVERSPDIIARVDASLRLCYINPAVERLTGKPRDWFIGKTPAERELSHQEVIVREAALRDVFESGEERVVEHKNPSTTGERYFQTRLVPEFGPDGRVESVLVVERDIDDLKRAQDALEELTLLDPLTGVANRRFLERFVGREWLREARQRLPIAAIMIDIDHFKDYNDHYGHAQGDDCLRTVSQALRKSLHRPADILVRYGGEEFIVLLPESDLGAAREIAERLRQAVEAMRLPHPTSPIGDRVTISLGVAAIKPHEGEFGHLLVAADAALYRAKERGRNRVEMSAGTSTDT
jgi:diguanylate cyclase (GGDEF)-like protein/PAS domain S-box-containing protein